VQRRKRLSNSEFVERVREYLPMNADIRETSAAGKAGRLVRGPELKDDTFYVFDAEAICSLSHAIEDVALDAASGTLLSAFQAFKNFEAHRERYRQLAVTIDRVQVCAAGRRPKAARHVQFLRDTKGRLRPYWAVLYAGPARQALLVGRETTNAREWDDKRFLGFYSFDARVIARVVADVQDLATSRAKEMREFLRLRAIDRAAKELDTLLARERNSALAALCKFKHKEGFEMQQFLADWEKSLARLQQWKFRLLPLPGESKANNEHP
jgi:diguanylate cyclase/two-component system sensory protein